MSFSIMLLLHVLLQAQKQNQPCLLLKTKGWLKRMTLKELHKFKIIWAVVT